MPFRVQKFDTLNEMKIVLSEHIELFKKEFGVLCFFYSLLLTKVVSALQSGSTWSQFDLFESILGLRSSKNRVGRKQRIPHQSNPRSWKVKYRPEASKLVRNVHESSFISQSLTNLMLCGVATSNVFDGDKCLEGLSKSQNYSHLVHQRNHLAIFLKQSWEEFQINRPLDSWPSSNTLDTWR